MQLADLFRFAVAIGLWVSPALAQDADDDDGPPFDLPPPIEAFHTVVFGGEGEAADYAAPALLHLGLQRLLLVCEARVGGDDGGRTGERVDIVARVSDDDGRTWSDAQTVHSAPSVSFGNPTLVFDETAGLLHLFTTRNGRELQRAQSADSGASWSAPVPVLTDPVEWGDVVDLGIGPGHGLQVSTGPAKGRLAVPLWMRRGLERRLEARVLYSDDGGDVWSLGGPVPAPRCSQASLCEFQGGVLVLNLRVQGSERRAIARSENGGIDWSEPEWNNELRGPTSHAAWIRVAGPADAGRERLLYCAPAQDGEGGRSAMTVRLSGNAGSSWPVYRAVTEAPCGYGDLARSPQDAYFIAFESGGGIELWNFDIHWLTEAWAMQGGPPSPSTGREK